MVTGMPARLANTARSALIASLIMALPLAGCLYFEGGPLYSANRFTYISTPDSPKTITLYDVTSNQAIWSYEIPVGRQLVIDFNRNAGEGEGSDYPDLMKWNDFPAGELIGLLGNELSVPPPTARRVELTLRVSPESIGEDLLAPPPTPAAQAEPGGTTTN